MVALVGAFVGDFVGAAVTCGFLVVAGFLVVEDVFLVVACGFLVVGSGDLAVVRCTAEPADALPALIVGCGCETAADDAAAAVVEPGVVTIVTPAVLSKTNEYEPFDETASAFGR